MRAVGDITSTGPQKQPEGLNKLGKPYRVLVVDDSSTMRKIVIQHLKSEAYEICAEAGDGKEAVERFKELAPDVVTLDINMPEMDGIAALKAIIEYDKAARVVMLTSEGEKSIVLQAISSGAKGYVMKPPVRAKLCEAVKKALEGQG
jgi:two-component system, chemotaxis family, chemotaxis protein CheY